MPGSTLMCQDYRGQPCLGLGRHRAHPSPARAAELRDPGTQRDQPGIRARSRRGVRRQRGLRASRGAGGPARCRRGRRHGEGAAPPRARLGRTCRRQAVYCGGHSVAISTRRRAMAPLAAEPRVRYGRRVAGPPGTGDRVRRGPAQRRVQWVRSCHTTMIGVSVPGDVVVPPNAHMLDAHKWANLLTVAVGPSLDTLNHVLGESADLSALSAIRRPLITAGAGTRSSRRRSTRSPWSAFSRPGRSPTSPAVRAVAGGIGFPVGDQRNRWNAPDHRRRRLARDLSVDGRWNAWLGRACRSCHPGGADTEWPALTSLEGAPAFTVGRAYAAFCRGRHRQRDSYCAGLPLEAVRLLEAVSPPSSRSCGTCGNG